MKHDKNRLKHSYEGFIFHKKIKKIKVDQLSLESSHTTFIVSRDVWRKWSVSDLWLGHSNRLPWSTFLRTPRIRKSPEESESRRKLLPVEWRIIAVQIVLQSTWGCCISGTRNRRDSFISLFLSVSSSLTHKNADISWPRTPVSHPSPPLL